LTIVFTYCSGAVAANSAFECLRFDVNLPLGCKMIKNGDVLAQFDSSILQVVARASKRSSALVHEEMRKGVYSLATIASVAPWLGIFGTIVGIVNTFSGAVSGSRTSIMAARAKLLSESMWPTGLGLLVGLVALWSFEYLTDELRGLDRETENASLELLNQLSRFPRQFEIGPPLGQQDNAPVFGERTLDDLEREDKLVRRCILIAGMALVTAWFVELARYFYLYSLGLYVSAQTACLYVPLMFGISCLLVYPVSTRLLGRGSSGMAALGAAFCLCWILAEFALGVSLP
jgi:MotA/TolQ/ExbB proton channel family